MLTCRCIVVQVRRLCFKVFTKIDEVMVQPLKNAKDRYEEMKALEETSKDVSQYDSIVDTFVVYPPRVNRLRLVLFIIKAKI